MCIGQVREGDICGSNTHETLFRGYVVVDDSNNDDDATLGNNAMLGDDAAICNYDTLCVNAVFGEDVCSATTL